MKVADITSTVKDFLRLADIGRSRSSILNQLQWTMAILIAGIVAFQLAHSPAWLSIFLAVLLALDAAVFLLAFLYFMLKRPHSLRSESFDYRMTQLIEKRSVQMEAGQYEELSEVSELKEHAVSANDQELEGQKNQ
jgi:preprotein translocase subunit YajC